MIKRCILLVSVTLAAFPSVLPQNANSSTTSRPRSTNSNQSATPSPKPTSTVKPATPKPAASSTQPKSPVEAKAPAKTGAAAVPDSTAVVRAFNKLLDGIRQADPKAVTSVYWNSPRLVLFNNNGTVTKGWEQLRKNREESYPNVKDVKLDVHDLSVTMLGRDGAVVTCLWTQSQSYKGTPEAATGRMTLIFKRVGKDWKVIHLHTSPEGPNPSVVLPSEQVPESKPSPTPTPTP